MSGIHSTVGKEKFISAVGTKKENTSDPDIVATLKSVMNKKKLNADPVDKSVEPELENRIVCFEKDVLKADPDDKSFEPELQDKIVCFEKDVVKVDPDDNKSFQLELQNRIVCFEKDVLKAVDLHVDGKGTSGIALLQNKVKHMVKFFSQLSKDEDFQSEHITHACDESTTKALNSESTFHLLQVAAKESSLEDPLEGRSKTVAINQTSESIAHKEACSIRTFWKVPLAELSNLSTDSSKSQSAGDFSDDAEEMESPSWLGDLLLENTDGKTSSEFPHDIYIRTEVGEVEDFPQPTRDINDSIHGQVPSSESDEGIAFSRNSLVHCGHGKLSFSDSGVLPDHLSYSGHLPYSGMSVLSDENSSSTGSFAFPILQPEWNCSPQRMESRERKYYNRHRRWRLGFLCCRF